MLSSVKFEGGEIWADAPICLKNAQIGAQNLKYGRVRVFVDRIFYIWFFGRSVLSFGSLRGHSMQKILCRCFDTAWGDNGPE